ncbi:MAG: acetylglutamate kinase [Armatimonadetes bacterium]|uniref:Acetylglutamate kinase n=1 Tax=Candidatus Nitrosymbiomonas proteolyticus TaxID=2608984 RepID=A0A809R767_9BACT|nr:acetylglutamate kinase [Armatimonadota bacterium]MCK6631452.1 acetylglutamate kinase [Fimbriimonadaceae bacterium]BBO23380.1 N-acetylglutamate kinase [Candidatus Nitrosymbiomonas proteolyticus]NOG37939.1 acetylglutamate kinase [Armatimonadota bacterium]NUM39486.1 acetylglutamate kinase [Armatimonadota bacterium]
MTEYETRAETLIQALPYIQAFSGKTVVVKYGGAAMTDEALKREVMRDLVLMRAVGIRPVLVHGGGPEVDKLMRRVGKEPEKVHGMRVTDSDTMDLVEMVLSGSVNKALVAGVQLAGGRAVGLSGKDGGLFLAQPLPVEGVDLGFVGQIIEVRPELLSTLTDSGYIPVLCSIAVDREGQGYNVNADLAAGAVAGALQAEKLIILTDVEGVLSRYPDPASLLSQMSPSEAGDLLSGGTVEKGMIPKVQACLTALEGGAHSAHIIDGRRRHSLLIEVFTDAGIGTMIS